MQNDIILFENFMFKKWKTIEIKHERNGDTVYNKDIIKNGNKYYITARFSRAGGYCGGYLTDENGTAIINGNGFPVDTFLDLLSFGLKAI